MEECNRHESPAMVLESLNELASQCIYGFFWQKLKLSMLASLCSTETDMRLAIEKNINWFKQVFWHYAVLQNETESDSWWFLIILLTIDLTWEYFFAIFTHPISHIY